MKPSSTQLASSRKLQLDGNNLSSLPESLGHLLNLRLLGQPKVPEAFGGFARLKNDFGVVLAAVCDGRL